MEGKEAEKLPVLFAVAPALLRTLDMPLTCSEGKRERESVKYDREGQDV